MLGLWATPVQAQEFGRVGKVEVQGSAYHVFAEPGEATIRVMVLGTVVKPGLYEVNEDVDLGGLLALTGGVDVGPLSSREERTVTLRLLRPEGGQRRLLYEAPLEQMLSEPGRYPRLMEGDVFTVEAVIHERSRFTWRDVTGIITSAVSLILLAERLGRI